jgi:hypothetical protein
MAHQQPPYGGPPWQPQQPGDPQYPTQPHSGDPHGRRARSPKHRHRVRNVILSIIGLIIVLVAIGTALSGGKSPGKPAAGASTPSATPAAANTDLTASQQQFVNDMQSSTVFNIGSSTSASQIADFGQTVCSDRQSGQSQPSVITSAQGDWTNASAMMAGQTVRLAEKDMCSQFLPAETVTYIVKGTPGAEVTYGPSGSNYTGNVPMHVTAPLGSPTYYAINAQLQGYGTVTCVIEVDGVPLSTATASGGYNIADCEIGQDPITNLWENDNNG